MQGEQVEDSIIQALNAIYNSCTDQHISTFDCVVIIRGGGATADLSGFDALQLAENVAQFPLPIITGIGHDRDESILDMVSNTRVKTPTAAAQLIISHLDSTSQRIDTCGERINTFFSLLKTREEARIDKLSSYLSPLISHLLEREQHKLEMLEQRAKALDPALLLKRGYSITLRNGHLLRNAAEVEPGTELETRLEQGTIISIVK
jgi:exodeoxyribonuclease VII large subunit